MSATTHLSVGVFFSNEPTVTYQPAPGSPRGPLLVLHAVAGQSYRSHPRVSLDGI